MSYRLQFSISTADFVKQKEKLKKSQQKKVIDYLKDMGRLVTSINNKKRKLLRMFSGQKDPYFIPLKVKCIKQRLRFHKPLPKTITEKGKTRMNLDSFRDPQVSMAFEFTPFSEEIEENVVREYIKAFNSEPDCLMKLKNNDTSLHMMYMSKLTRFVYNIYNSLQVDWELFCKVHKMKHMRLEMFNITYLKV